MNFLKKHLNIFVIVIFSLGLIAPYFQKGYFPTHDGEWAVVRLADMYREVKDQQFPPRFSGNLNAGYGYPLFEFAYPLPYYLGLPLLSVHFGLVNSIKLLFALTVPLSGIMMYLSSWQLWKRKGSALLSAVLYMYLPYRVVDLYVRGSIGESLASVFFPTIIYLLGRLSERQSHLLTAFLGLSFAGLILTHNIMAVLFGIVIVAYGLFLLKTEKIKFVTQGVVGLGLGVGLSAFFWAPALLEKNLILLSQIPIADRSLYYVNLFQLLIPSWGYGTPTESNPFTYQLGLAHIAVLLIACGIFLRTIFSSKKSYSISTLLVLLSIFFISMMFPFSGVIWENTPLLKEINYPWTVLLPLGFLISLLAGAIPLKTKVSQAVALSIALCSIILVLPYAAPKEHVDRGEGYYLTNDATTTSSHELMPLWVKEIPTIRPVQKVAIIKGEGVVSNIISNSKLTSFSLQSETDTVVRLNTIYYPGWHWYTGSEEIAITYQNPQGVMEAKLPKGNYIIQAVFKETPLRMVVDGISLVSLVFVIGLMTVGLKNKKTL